MRADGISRGGRAHLDRALARPLLSRDAEDRLLALVAEAKVARRGDLGIGADELRRRIEIGEEAKTRLCLAYEKLVIRYARPFQGRGLGLDDLVQEGMTALVAAFDAFADSGLDRFSAYVEWPIKRGLAPAVDRARFVVSVPERKAREARRVELVERSADREQEHLDSAEIAARANVPAAEVASLRALNMPSVLLSSTLPGSNVELADALHYRNETDLVADTGDSTVVTGELHALLSRVLSDRELTVLVLWYGIQLSQSGQTGETYSVADIARMIGLSGTRVRHVHATAIDKLRGYAPALLTIQDTLARGRQAHGVEDVTTTYRPR